MIESDLIGKTTMELLDFMESDPKVDGGKIVAVGVVCIVENTDGDETFTRTWCSDEMHHHQLGLFHAAVEVITTGHDGKDE